MKQVCLPAFPNPALALYCIFMIPVLSACGPGKRSLIVDLCPADGCSARASAVHRLDVFEVKPSHQHQLLASVPLDGLPVQGEYLQPVDHAVRNSDASNRIAVTAYDDSGHPVLHGEGDSQVTLQQYLEPENQ